MKKKEIRIRCWIDIDGLRFFGPGRLELLSLIDESGSIVKAAKAMGMSYKKAWDMVDDMNTRGKKPLVVARKGGDKGGGTELTDTGRKMIAKYDKLMTKLNSIIEKNGDILNLI
jgi:molybdate transport system regulatory protein